MEQSSSRRRRLLCEKLSTLLQKPVNYRRQNSATLTWLNPVHIPNPCFYIMLLSILVSSKWSHSLTFFLAKSVFACILISTSYTPRPTQPRLITKVLLLKIKNCAHYQSVSFNCVVKIIPQIQCASIFLLNVILMCFVILKYVNFAKTSVWYFCFAINETNGAEADFSVPFHFSL